MVLSVYEFCTACFLILCFQTFQAQPILKSQVLTADTYTVPGSNVNGVVMLWHHNEVVRFNSTWYVGIRSQSTWQFILSLDNSWGFDPLFYSSIKLTIHSPSVATGPSTFDWLMFGFTSDNSEYISSLVAMENVEHNRIYPGCDTSTIPTMLHGVGDIASMPDNDRSCDIAGGLCTNWQDMLPVNLPVQRNGFPISFQFENDPQRNTLRVTFSSATYTGSFQQQCGFVSSPTNQGLKMYFGGNDPRMTFQVTSFELSAWSQTESPTSSPSKQPSASPSKPPTNQPTRSPSTDPTRVPTNAPTGAPSLAPSSAPSQAPSTAPTPAPTDNPTPSPTAVPSMSPSGAPSQPPTLAPSNSPTFAPSNAPTQPPTQSPTLAPVQAPSSAPSMTPTQTPSSSPTLSPSLSPTLIPSLAPSNTPSTPPTTAPTLSPVQQPTNAPTVPPSNAPTGSPSPAPTGMPTIDPTIDPTTEPTIDPTVDPTVDPTMDPTRDPTIDPTVDPTRDPTTDPTKDPTTMPTTDPSVDPTSDPTVDPTDDPTSDPTMDPTVQPTEVPTNQPTSDPTNDPTSPPSVFVSTDSGEEQLLAVSNESQFDQFILPVAASLSILAFVIMIRVCVGCYKKREDRKGNLKKLSFIEIIAPTPQLAAVKSESPYIDTYLITVHFGRYHFRYVMHRGENVRDGAQTGMNLDDCGWDDQTYNDLRKAIEDEFGLEFTAFGLYENVGGDEVLIEDIDDVMAGFDSTHNIRTTKGSMAMDIFVKILDDVTEGNTTGKNFGNDFVTKRSFTGISNLDESESSSGDPDTGRLLIDSDGCGAVASHKLSTESSSEDDMMTPGGHIEENYNGIDNLDDDEDEAGEEDNVMSSSKGLAVPQYDDEPTSSKGLPMPQFDDDEEEEENDSTRTDSTDSTESTSSSSSSTDSDEEDESIAGKPQQLTELL